MSAKKHFANKETAASAATRGSRAAAFLRRLLPVVLGWLCVLVSLSFFTATYDTAQVKLTLLQMGSVTLLALWAALKLAERKNPFTRQTCLFLLPVLAYLGWNTFSFLLAPYKWEAAEEFIRLWMYGGITLLAATELTQENIKTLTKFILAAAWISVGYGLLQVADGFVPGADFMPWRAFFDKRVFSTHANPNFYGAFVVFTSCVAAMQFLVTRKKSLLALLGAASVTLFFTESKGAWIAYAAAIGALAVGYGNFLAENGRKKIINLAAVGAVMAALLLAGVYSAKRFQSVSFRTYTWLSAFEMVQDAPIIGTGPGSFKIIYPRYRRPQIFYIENSHNTETQHAENEYLEQWATTGTVGLAVFLWMVLFALWSAVATLRRRENNSPDLRTRNLYLLGYAAALTGLLVHATVDISLRFASSGLFFALFIGILLALNRPEQPVAAAAEKASPAWAVWGLRILLVGALGGSAAYLLGQFNELTAALRVTTLGEGFLLGAAWGVLLFCLGGVICLFVRAAFLTRRAPVILPLLAAVPLLVWFYGFFQANHYYSLGVSLVQGGNIEGAVGYFTKAIQLNPLAVEYRQYRANTLATALQLTQTFSPSRGDEKAPSNDYERALKDFALVRARAPYHTQLHQSIGHLYYGMALRQAQAANQTQHPAERAERVQQAEENFRQARRALERALELDPVEEKTYAYLASIALLQQKPQLAQHWIDAYRRGPDGVTEPDFLTRHRQLSPFFGALEQQTNALLREQGVK